MVVELFWVPPKGAPKRKKSEKKGQRDKAAPFSACPVCEARSGTLHSTLAHRRKFYCLPSTSKRAREEPPATWA